MRERKLRIALVVVDLFLAVSAFAGAVGLVVGPIVSPSALRGSPFVDFTVPALLLGIAVGGSALAAAAVALVGRRRMAPFGPWRFDALASAVAGCVMVGWMTVEVAMIGLGSWLQPAYLIVGLLMIGLAALLQRAESRQRAESHPAGVGGGHRAAR